MIDTQVRVEDKPKLKSQSKTETETEPELKSSQPQEGRDQAESGQAKSVGELGGLCLPACTSR